MFRRLRENGPVVLVPLAWTFATAGHLGAISVHTLTVGHVVIDAILVAFAAASWSEMTDGVLYAWKVVLLVGLACNLVGTVGLAASPVRESLLFVTVSGWMLVPGAGLVYTGRRVTGAPAYLAGGALSVAGWVVYVAGLMVPAVPLVAGLALVGVGQTAGIADAVYRY